ncbi:PrsW family intramembrane metalloprotease [Natranaeroarchaeum aerophilus]|uniref:PrsW family intramembrane metalloprotease n=1 Tax=Natranaeroarchaeum aerophilus TaxID=2917711 RepID=A0AAE3K404_9EURY|nr:PrsW family intramembrane metalloprotease [Natranaeroarchaeum aerophilus]MCL9812741.1 PrsW family intramembrane metalloprotease [Natranaeroarchaeum aerophilus]
MERDPVERVADDDVDLYEVSSWEPRTRLDRLLVGTEDRARTFYRLLVWLAAGLALASVIGVSALVLVAEFQFGNLDAVTDPVVTVLVVLSVVPALLIAAYIWHVDVTTGEPASLLVVTFLLTMVLAGAAALLNELGSTIINVVGAATFGAEVVGTPIMLVLFFFLVVGPVEETVKLLAIRLYAYRDDRFDAVIDGAVYGAVAGLGFATIENALYITRPLESVTTTADVLQTAGGTTAARTLAGPGHVIYSALAGFYLGLAKFNRDHAVPLVAKGLLLAAVIHATYNTGASIVPPWLVGTLSLSSLSAVVIYVVAFDIAAGYFLYLKLKRYQDTYRAVGAGQPDRAPTPELAEFDGSTHTAPTSTGAVAVTSQRTPSDPPSDSATGSVEGPGSTGSGDRATGSPEGTSTDGAEDGPEADSLDDWEFQ